MKQPQFSPVPVEEQVAIIYASTKGLLDRVPVEKVREFEKEFLTIMRTSERAALDLLKAGKLDEAATSAIEKTVKDLASRY